MEKTVYFLSGGATVALPVTPKAIAWGRGKAVETVNIHSLGDVTVPGRETRYNGTIEALLPGREYPFAAPGSGTDPYRYVEILSSWAKSREPVRMIVAGTDINVQVLVQSVEYGESDGTGDVTAKITIREWVDLEAVAVSNSDTVAQTGNRGQPSEAGTVVHTVVPGDMLSVLCRRYYGNGTAKYYEAVAKHNGISNPHLIRPGQVLRFPPAGELLGR